MPYIVDEVVRTRQPSGPAPINPTWLERGLTFFNAGNGYYWQKGKGWMGTGTIAGTPKNVSGKLGVAKGVGTTLGTGTTDRIDAGVRPVGKALARSIVAHLYVNGGGGGGLGRVFQDVSGTGLTAGDESLFFFTGGTNLSYVRLATGVGQWYSATAQPTGRWSSFGTSLDESSVGTTPALYVDGAAVSVNVGSATSGSYTNAGTMFSWGNRSSDSARNWDGLIGPIAFFDTLLKPAEHKSLNDNIWQLLEDDDLTYFDVGGGGNTAALTGQAATGTQGTPVPSLSLATTGNSSTATNGAVTPSLSLALSGNSATSAAGTPTSSVPGGVGLSGNSATASQGTPTASLSLAITGNSSTSSAGTPTSALSQTAALSGQSATASQGTPIAALSLALSGNGATSAVGTVTANSSGGTITVALTGNEATATAGQVGTGDTGAGRSKRKFQVETSRGVREVETLDEVAQILRDSKKIKALKTPAVVKLDGYKVATPSLKASVDYKAIEARLRQQIQDEMDEEELMLLL